MTRGVPKIIHQTWKSKNIVDKTFLELQKTWKTNNPHWEYRLYDDEDLENYVRKHHPEYLDTWNSMQKQILKVDTIRYMWMYDAGGVYVDMDFECYKPLDKLLATMAPGAEVGLGQEPKEHKSTCRIGKLFCCNAFMVSAPRHRFWLHVLEEIKKNVDPKSRIRLDAVQATGPCMLQRAYESWPHKDQIHVWSPRAMYPLSIMPNSFYNKETRKRMRRRFEADPNVYACHHWAGSWHRPGWQEVRGWWGKHVQGYRGWVYLAAALTILICVVLVVILIVLAQRRDT